MLNEVGYGPHLMVDMYGCDVEALRDVEDIYHFLNKLPGMVGMETLCPPNVHPYVNENPTESGVTGIVIITTSHSSLHTYPNMNDLEGRPGMAFFDLFSCKEFDPDLVVSLLEAKFKPVEMDRRLEIRGLKFPGLHARCEGAVSLT